MIVIDTCAHRHTHTHAHPFNTVLFHEQTLSEVEDGLREFEQRVAELRSRAEGRQPDQISNQELLKLQVTTQLCLLITLSYNLCSIYTV